MRSRGFVVDRESLPGACSRRLKTGLLIGLCVCGLAYSERTSPLSETEIARLKERATVEGWPFRVGRNDATTQPLDVLHAAESVPDGTANVRVARVAPREDHPRSFDWREMGACTPIRNCSVCGADWAFATNAVLESAILIRDGLETDLSERWLIDCNQSDWSCSRGSFAFSYFLEDGGNTDACGHSGAVLEKDLPYIAGKLPCKCPYPHEYFIRSWSQIAPESGSIESGDLPSVGSIKQAILDHGPVAAMVTVSDPFWAYEEGVFGGTASAVGEPDLHVVLVGWNDDLGKEGAWILRNCWGTGWGDHGYMYIEYGCSNVGYRAAFIDYVGEDALYVSTPTDLAVSGVRGRQFEPETLSLILENRGAGDLAWTAEESIPWADLAPSQGVLASQEGSEVHLTINGNASRLATGQYRGEVTITHIESGVRQSRFVNLDARPPTVVTESLEEDPHWGLQGRWAFGTPLGECQDPTSGFTGQCVYGYALDGCYDSRAPEYFLSSPSFDCLPHTGVRLKFRRWLGIKSADEDRARIQASRDGIHWFDVWTHTGVGINDRNWISCEYDVSHRAAGAKTAYFRWGMGPTGRPNPCGGWNLDDVEILGDSPDTLFVLPAEDTVFRGPEGGAFDPSTAELELGNSASFPIDWQATVSADWLNVSALGGHLDADAAGRIQVSLNAQATRLDPGNHLAKVAFKSLVSGITQEHRVLLEIRSSTGRIRVHDSVSPASDHRIDFGPVILGSTRMAEITIANIDSLHPLTLTALSIDGRLDEHFELEGISDWKAAGAAEWGFAGGRLAASMSGEDSRASIRYSAQQWQDAAVSVEGFLPEFRSGGVVLFVRASPDFDWSVPRGSAYCLGIERDGRCWVGRYLDGAFTVFRDKTEEYPSGPLPTSSVLALSICGSILEARIDGALVWSGKDSAISSGGHIALGVYGDSEDTLEYSFDELHVSPPVGEAPANPIVLVSSPELPLRLAPHEKTTLSIEYTPTRESPDVTCLHIWSDDTADPHTVVDVAGDAYKPVHFVHVPLADTTATGSYQIQAQITARYGVGGVRLIWSTDGGVTTYAVDMIDQGDGVYEAWIPEQPIGTRISYRIEGTDAQGDTTYEPEDGFVTFQVRGIPRLVTEPDHLSFVVPPNASAKQVLRIENSGTWPVEWTVFSLPEVRAGLASVPEYVPAAKRSHTVDWKAGHFVDTLLVGFQSKTGVAEKAFAHTALASAFPGSEVIHRYRRIPVDVVRVPQKADLEAAAKAYEQQRGVAYVEPNARMFPCYLPSDPQFRQLWGLNNEGQTGGSPDADIDAPEAWELERGSRDIVVAVIDTGIDYTHEDLAANIWVNAAERDGTPGVDDDGNGIIDDIHGARWQEGTGQPTDGNPMDIDYHGTHCAGTIGAVGDNDKGVAGVNWSVTLMPLKFLSRDGGWTTDAVSALEYAIDKGAHLTSNSWGGGMYSQALEDMIAASGEAGMLFVCAAGNYGINIDDEQYYPARYNLPNVIAVAASDFRDRRASFSNYGRQSVHLAAPGLGILSTFPGNAYGSASGTSMATPHVAGVAALLLARVPSATPSLVKQWLLDSVDLLPEWAHSTVSGGRLNAANALLKAGVPWLKTEPSSGSLRPGQQADIVVTADARHLGEGYIDSARLVFSGIPQGTIETPVDLLVAGGAFTVTPDKAFKASGQEGGVLAPTSLSYSIRNLSGKVLQWKARAEADWIDVVPSSGTVPPGQASTVVLSLNEKASTLPTSVWRTQIVFTNKSASTSVTREAVLTIEPPPATPFFRELLDQDPQWDARGEWQFGPPLGACLDPGGAHTGANVYGCNLGGCYAPFLNADILITTPIDCSRYSNVELRFWRWLAIESFEYDAASVWVSNDLENWSLLWDHIGDTFSDAEWKQQTFDISTVADGRPTVYICWAMGPTDSNTELGGLNIDDIELCGRLAKDLAVVPFNGIEAVCHADESHEPVARTYTLWNMTGTPIEWQVSRTEEWVNLSKWQGALEPGKSAQVHVSVDATSLPPGTYGDVVTFANRTTQSVQTRSVDIAVLPPTAKIDIVDSVVPYEDKTVPFDSVPIGESKNATLTIRNLHETNDLLISDLVLPQSTVCPFSLRDIPVPPIRVFPGQSMVFQVVFSPLKEGFCEAPLSIASNDSEHGNLDVLLTGEALPEGAPLIVTQPFSQTANSGDTVVFVVGAKGDLLSYQWEKDGKVIAGATLASLTIPSVSRQDVGAYVCHVSNPRGLAPSEPADLTVRELPTAAFTAEPISGGAPLEVQFHDASMPGDAPVESWLWSFGDGGTASEANPRHTYLTAGTYAVSLEVRTSLGADRKELPGFITVSGAEGEGEGEPVFGCYAEPPSDGNTIR